MLNVNFAKQDSLDNTPHSSVCKICGGEDFKIKYVVKNYTIEECLRCGFVQVHDIDNLEKYEYTNEYFTNNKYDDKVSLKRENTRRKKLLNYYCTKGAKVLDVGCAAGDFVSFVREDYNIFGCDFSSNAIKIAKEKYPEIAEKFRVSNAEAVENERFDAICMWDVIEHIYDPKTAISQLLNMIGDDGYLFISTPNIGALFSTLTGAKWPFMTPPEHVGFFSKKSMNYMIHALGLPCS